MLPRVTSGLAPVLTIWTLLISTVSPLWSRTIPNSPTWLTAGPNLALPPMGEAALDGPAQVKIGEETVFTVALTNRNTGDAYPTADVKESEIPALQ